MSKNSATPIADTIDESLIKITDSTFINLNFGKIITEVSLLNNATMPVVSSVSPTFTETLQYPVFDNHGSVLNLQGFPGGIKVTGSTFQKNMVFIPEIYPSRRSAGDEIELLDNFINVNTGQIMTSRCNSTSVTRRFFSDYLNSIDE